MKKAVAPLIVFFALMFGSLGSAQSDGFGIYSGFPTWIGVQTQTGGLRLGVGLGYYGIAGSADIILAESPINTGNADFNLSWYYGAGLNAAFGLGSGFGTGLYLAPHGLVGLEFQIPTLTNISFYGEIQLGLVILPGIGPDYGGRSGIIFR